MSDILCRWLNEELRLSKTVEPDTFAKDFSTGYLIGEVLHKYHLQSDFLTFINKDSSVSRLHNFSRLEPTLKLLGIPFDTITAQGLMQEKPGVATHFLYQLYVALEDKTKADISGTLMEIMLPAAKAELNKKEHEYFLDKMHRLVERDATLKLQKLSQQYEEKIPQLIIRREIVKPVPEQSQLKVQKEIRDRNIEKFRMGHQEHHKMLTQNKTTIVHMPKPPPKAMLQLSLKKRKQQQIQKDQEAQMALADIAQCEVKRKTMVTSGFMSTSCSHTSEASGSGAELMLQSNSKYIQEIRRRLEEDAVAHQERAQRVERFLVEQFKAHEALQEVQRDEQLVKRLTRQTKQEQRLTVQLLQLRKQKEVIRQNCLFREQQYQQRREKDLQEALERKAALAQQEQMSRAEEMRKEVELCNRMAAEHAQSRYKKHFNTCREIVEQIVDLATKIGEYRLLTRNLIPAKLIREWKELLLSGLPLYKRVEGQQSGFELSIPLDPVDLKKQETLNSQDYDEYTNMVGDWAWPEEAGETMSTPTNNIILAHVVHRLRNIVHPPAMACSSRSLPHFTLKACVLGKFCSGKSTSLAKVAEALGVCILSCDRLIEEALDAYQNGEQIREQQQKTVSQEELGSCTSVTSDLVVQEESGESKLSRRAMLGAAAEAALKNGKPILDEIQVDIIVEAIRQISAHSGWILDGFPTDFNQAFLLEKALGGSVDDGSEVLNSRAYLALEPDQTKAPAPTAPVLDLVLLLDVPDECVIRRALTPADSPADAATCDPTEKTLFEAQIPHRITAFQDTWPNLEEWYGGKQDILDCVDADVDEEELCKRVEFALQKIMAPEQKDVVLDSGKSLHSSSSAASPPPEQAASVTDSSTSLNQENNTSVKSLSKSGQHSPAGQSRKASICSLHNGNAGEVLKNPDESTPSCPGSSSVYVDEPLPPDLPNYLLTNWDKMCESYVSNLKAVMQELRTECTLIIQHLFNLREEFKHYLQRPDKRQEFVCQWQRDFNRIPEDMSSDDDTKAELHLRLDELCERLWDICDKRKEKNEQERSALMGSRWLEDHTVILINHHTRLIQVELDRFWETLCILRCYYLGMCKQVMPEPPSKVLCIELLNITEMKDQEENDPVSSETIKPSRKLISDCNTALQEISTLVSAEAHPREGATELSDKVQETKEIEKLTKSHPSEKPKKKAQKKEKASPRPVSSTEPVEGKQPEKPHRLYQEYAAALNHEANAAKTQIMLVKGHGLLKLKSLQSCAEETFSGIEKSLEACYLAEMNSIEQLAEVVRHHIESGAKLQNELILDCADFYVNGDYRVVASPPPLPCPPPMEKATQSTLTVVQLESLCQQLNSVAPAGCIKSFKLCDLLRHYISVNMGSVTLPEPWINLNEAQILEMISPFLVENELMDWRQFLLSAALPWPIPSMAQLLVLLRHFKAVDAENKGYINEEQYLQTELWFPNEDDQLVPEDPSEPLFYDCLAGLRTFFFQLFADGSFSPPRLDYMSMLLYFAADFNPTQGFTRALSIVLGQHLKQLSTSHLIKSMPRIEEGPEFSSAELSGEYKGETPCASDNLWRDEEVSISALQAVICRSNHFVPGQEDYSEDLVCTFQELGYNSDDSIPFSVLSEHPFIQRLMESSTQYQLVNIHRVLTADQEEGHIHRLNIS
ncbi:sperm flagellar protein 2 [Thalassophryne amazonica]|uniref:sperm flagellar protein 2 n=1 Tax=Thalassophryne amazonica TaxID=390379 RepID=UPI001470E63C|nr:sperm flagellar protein 2 [Thalassophryne amazonica]